MDSDSAVQLNRAPSAETLSSVKFSYRQPPRMYII